jgi:REP element-mobilizing transposase RayT
MYLDGHIYHIFNRGAHRAKMYRNPFQFDLCLRIFERYQAKSNVEILAFCLMPNHYHLLLRQVNGGSIGSFLKVSFNAYVQSYNVIEHHSGTILQGPPKKREVETEEYFQNLVRYIHFNPVAARLVTKPEDWDYSDYRQWVGFEPFRFQGFALRNELFEDAGGYKRFAEIYQTTAPKLDKDYLAFEN